MKTPVIVISGHLTNDLIEKLSNAGITRILRKPFKRSDFLNAIEGAVQVSQPTQ